MVVRDRSFPNGSPVCDYWLSRCEGFTVRAGGRSLGIVERLAFGMPAGRVEALVLRKRRRRRRALAAGQVLAVVPARQLLLARRPRRSASARRALRRGATRAARSVGAAAPVVLALAGAFGAVLWAFAVRAAIELRLATARLARAARDEIRDYERQRDLDRARRVEGRKEQKQRPTDRSQPQAVANDYAFALGHERVDVLGEQSAAAADEP